MEEKYREFILEIFDAIRDKAWDLLPGNSDYFGAGVAETMVLDEKKEISEELDSLFNDLWYRFCELEDDNA